MIRLATMNGPIGGLVPRLMLDFTTRYPGVRFHLTSRTGKAIIAMLKDSEADIGIGYNLGEDAWIAVVTQVPVRIGAVMDPRHPPLAQHQGLRLAACTPFVIVLADETMSLRPLLLDAALKIRTQIGPTTSTNSIEFMKRQLADAQSITFLAETDASVQPQMLSLVQRANAGLDRSAVLFLEQARAALELLGR